MVRLFLLVCLSMLLPAPPPPSFRSLTYVPSPALGPEVVPAWRWRRGRGRGCRPRPPSDEEVEPMPSGPRRGALPRGRDSSELRAERAVPAVPPRGKGPIRRTSRSRRPFRAARPLAPRGLRRLRLHGVQSREEPRLGPPRPGPARQDVEGRGDEPDNEQERKETDEEEETKPSRRPSRGGQEVTGALTPKTGTRRHREDPTTSPNSANPASPPRLAGTIRREARCRFLERPCDGQRTPPAAEGRAFRDPPRLLAPRAARRPKIPGDGAASA